MDSATQGDDALRNSNYPWAIRYFTQALIELPRAPNYYIKRSTAYSRLKPADGGPGFQAALRDAETALTFARERGNFELIQSAQMRRGVALFQLERYGDARFVFDLMKKKAATAKKGDQDKSDKVRDAMAGSAKKGYEQELPIWTLKVQGKLNKLDKGDEKAAVTVAEYPSDIQAPTEKDLKKQFEEIKAGHYIPRISGDDKTEGDASTRASESKDGSENAPAATSAPTGPTLDKIRHEWYQSNESVVVTIYVKGLTRDKVDMHIESDSVNIGFNLASGSYYDFNLEPLFAPIDPALSKVSVMSTKIEIVLRKLHPGPRWGALEASSNDVKLADRKAATGSQPVKPAGPSYPTSSRNGVKDWDKVASDLTAKKPKADSKAKSGDEDDGAGNESDDSDIGGGDPVDGFFKKLYAKADPDTRRAMMKSYVESQGTSLSTNWGEVGAGKVEARPPSD